MRKRDVRKSNTGSKKKNVDRLILSCNLLPWYNEVADKLEIHSPTFPKAVWRKIERFGPFEIEWISEKQTRLIKKAK